MRKKKQTWLKERREENYRRRNEEFCGQNFKNFTGSE
jgi:heme/copper-type cytochrome/quinol oxidase subunit 2